MEQEIFSVVGFQYGQFEQKDGPHMGDMQPYASIFAVEPMKGEQNENYHFCGSKALKFQCADASVLDKLQPGMNVNLFFDSKKHVTFYRVVPLPPAK